MFLRILRAIVFGVLVDKLESLFVWRWCHDLWNKFRFIFIL